MSGESDRPPSVDCIHGLNFGMDIERWHRGTGSGVPYLAAVCFKYEQLGMRLLDSCSAQGCDRGNFPPGQEAPATCPLEYKMDVVRGRAAQEIEAAIEHGREGFGEPSSGRSYDQPGEPQGRDLEGDGLPVGDTCMYNRWARTMIPAKDAVASNTFLSPKTRERARERAKQLRRILGGCALCDIPTGVVPSDRRMQSCPIGPALARLTNQRPIL